MFLFLNMFYFEQFNKHMAHVIFFRAWGRGVKMSGRLVFMGGKCPVVKLSWVRNAPDFTYVYFY